MNPLPRGIRARPDRATVQASLWVGGRRYQRTIARLEEVQALPESERVGFLEARHAEAKRKLLAEGPARRTAQESFAFRKPGRSALPQARPP